ncbi:MAG: hypothetical protein V9F00_14405 [Nocardioides sp.]|jgi:hypothetical protein
MKAIEPRPLAEHDLANQIRHYWSVGGTEFSDGFLDAAVVTLDATGDMPKARLAQTDQAAVRWASSGDPGQR